MKLFHMVDYKVCGETVRAILNIGTQSKIVSFLSEYHKTNQIEIKKVRILSAEQKLLYVQYFDR